MGCFVYRYKIMSYAEYKDLLEKEVEQLRQVLPAIRKAFEDPVVDGAARVIDTEMLISISEERRMVGDGLNTDDRLRVERELGL